MATTLSNHMTILALVNGMIGGIILVMPVMALKTGSIMIAPVVFISGFFSYYSCLLCLKHLRNYKDLDEAVLKHFGNKKSFKISYDICIAISIIVLLVLYFDLICKQWEGLTSPSRLIPLINAIVLFPVIYIMKKYHFGASLLAYGIISTIGYCFFILYMWVTAPEGEKHLEPIDKHFPELAAALSQGFAIQTMFIPILKQNENRFDYKKILFLTYLIGGIAYMFIGYGGALSIVNKTFPGTQKPQTITEYFDEDEWQVILLHIIYLVHLYSAFPEFLLISKKRLFSALSWPEPADVTFKEVIYVGCIILLCLIIKLTNMSAEFIIEINGSVISFIFITVIPVGLHIKCLFFPEPEEKHQNWQDERQNKGLQQQKYEELKEVKNLNQGLKEEKANSQQGMQNAKSDLRQKEEYISGETFSNRQEKQKQEQIQRRDHGGCQQCDTKNTKSGKIVEGLIIVLMIASGVATMVYTIYIIYEDSLETPTL